jgi:5-methylcytosine-specific restriction endonuclease McrA
MIRPRSVKRQKLYDDLRKPLVIELLSLYPNCQRCKTNPSQDVHEIKTRARGGSITDKNNLAVLCRPCHNWVTTHPKEAREQGWLKNSWE